MKIKISLTKIFILTAAALYLFAGCSGITGNEPEQDTGLEKRALLININDADDKIAGLSPGKIIPDVDMTRKYYIISGSCEDGSVLLENSSLKTVRIEGLSAGKWTIKAEAVNHNNISIAYGESAAEVPENAASSVSVNMAPYDGFGVINISADWNAKVHQPFIEGTIGRIGGIPHDIPFVISDNNASASLSCAAGDYIVEINLYDRSNTELTYVGGKSQAVTIFKAMETSVASSFSSDSSVTIYIEVNLCEPINISIAGIADSYIEGADNLLEASSDNASDVKYRWYINGNLRSSTHQFNVGTLAQAGKYRLDATAFNSAGTRGGSVSDVINVTEAPVSSFFKFSGSSFAAQIIQDARLDANCPGRDLMVITQTDSDTGIKDILGVTSIGDPLGTPKCDIAMSSRNLTAEELAYGVLYPVAICKDAVVFIVHKDLYDAGVTRLSAAQIRQIYAAQNINALYWDQVVSGAPHQLVVPRATSAGSGTRDLVLSKFDVNDAAEQAVIAATGLTRFTGNADAAAAINNGSETNQLGYCGLRDADDPAYAGLRKIAILNPDSGSYVDPAFNTILDRTYAGARDIWLLIRVDLLSSSDAYLVPFLQWMEDQAGGQIHAANARYISPVPDWDVVFSTPVVHLEANPKKCYVIGGQCDVTDLGQVRLVDWFTSGAPHWIRSDINSDGLVDITDLGELRLNHWFEYWFFPIHPE